MGICCFYFKKKNKKALKRNNFESKKVIEQINVCVSMVIESKKCKVYLTIIAKQTILLVSS